MSESRVEYGEEMGNKLNNSLGLLAVVALVLAIYAVIKPSGVKPLGEFIPITAKLEIPAGPPYTTATLTVDWSGSTTMPVMDQILVVRCFSTKPDGAAYRYDFVQKYGGVGTTLSEKVPWIKGLTDFYATMEALDSKTAAKVTVTNQN